MKDGLGHDSHEDRGENPSSFGPLPSLTTAVNGFNDFDVKGALEQCRKMQARMHFSEASCNFDLLEQRCSDCGHLPRIEGGNLFICDHTLAKLRDACDTTEKTQPASPFAMFTGLAIFTETVDG